MGKAAEGRILKQLESYLRFTRKWIFIRVVSGFMQGCLVSYGVMWHLLLYSLSSSHGKNLIVTFCRCSVPGNGILMYLYYLCLLYHPCSVCFLQCYSYLVTSRDRTLSSSIWTTQVLLTKLIVLIGMASSFVFGTWIRVNFRLSQKMASALEIQFLV